jgi:hypothetical protein
MSKVMIWAYGVGHFINDLVAACWFNFLFYYLKRVVETPASNAALLSGQICDGIATPIVGYISDKYNTRWGKLIFLSKVKELPGTFSDWYWSLVATFQFTKDFSPLTIEAPSTHITPFSLDFSISDGRLYRSAT